MGVSKLMLVTKPYEHTCRIERGSMMGSDHVEEVSAFDVEYQTDCPNCGQVKAPIERIVAFIYGQITGEN